MFNRQMTGMIAVAALSCSAGCASIRSTRLPPDTTTKKVQGGMVYYLPTQRFELTLTVDDKGSHLALAASKAIPDTKHRYVAQFRRNHVGSNKLAIKSSVDGLLSGELTGSTTGQLSDALKALASSAGAIRPMNASAENACKAKGVYKWVFGPDIPAELVTALNACGLEVSPKKPDGGQYDVSTLTTDWKGVSDNTVQGTGFFYRQRMPFVIEVTHTTSAGAAQTFLFYESIASDHSPIEFMPVPRTLFATTQWKVMFDQGVPTVYDIEAGGDFIGLFKLPADVITAYSTAIGEGFKRRKETSAAEAAYLEQVNKLAVQQAKYDICRAAVQSGDNDKIKTACQ